MRRKNHRGRVAGQFFHGARQMHPPRHPVVRRMPQPGAVKPGLRKIHKGLVRQGTPLGFGAFRETQREVAMHDTPALQHQRIQQPAQQPAQRANHAQRQKGQQLHDTDTGPGRYIADHLPRLHRGESPGFAAAANGSWRGVL